MNVKVYRTKTVFRPFDVFLPSVSFVFLISLSLSVSMCLSVSLSSIIDEVTMIWSQEKCILVTLNLHPQFVTPFNKTMAVLYSLEDSLLNCAVLECKYAFSGGILSI